METPNPPREPDLRSLRTRDAAMSGERPARVQMVIALFLGVVLVAIPLYLWRRPRAEAPVIKGDGDAAAQVAPPPAAAQEIDAGAIQMHAEDAKVIAKAGDPNVIECHDRGTKKTAAAACDHLVAFEKAFTQAIEHASGPCAEAAASGAIDFVADVSFARKKHPIGITIGRGHKTGHAAKEASACVSAVKETLPDSALDGLTHAHDRYKIEISAAYTKRAQ